jgi:predicted RNA-binding Zn-ribbon protein involved in translation (DUF1610 family)
MSRDWTPKSQVSITDTGLVIEIHLDGIRDSEILGGVTATLEAGQLCLRGQHKVFGPFESRIEIPPGYNLRKFKATIVKGVLRIVVPPGKDASSLAAFPRSMLIYCNGCGKHFDIVITGKGPGNYPCPACGKVQVLEKSVDANNE